MKEINKQSNLSTSYTENLYKIIQSIKTNDSLCNIFTKYVDENKNEPFL